MNDLRQYLDYLEKDNPEPTQYEAPEEPDGLSGPDADFLTDLGNGRRLTGRHGADVRFCAPLGGWFWWDGKRWARDESGQIMRLAKDTALTQFDEATRALDAARAAVIRIRNAGESPGPENTFEEQKRMNEALLRSKRRLGWAIQTQAKARLDAMIALAESELPVVAGPADFDTDRWLLNVDNGTLDLRMGVLRPHSRADLITKLAPVRYDPHARDPILDRYLADTTSEGGEDFAAFLQRAAGYSLTGCTDEEAFFLILGPGASGKSTLIEALLAMLGDYAAKAGFDTFLERRDVGGPRPDVARLRGARLVAAVETSKSQHLAEQMIKELVGGDTITVRHLYREPFSFVPECKLWLAANNSPRITDTDSGIWRRLRHVPFEHVIPPERRDPSVKRHLTSSPEARSALLAWAVSGCLAWQRQRLGTCETVSRATSDLRAEMNPLGEFLEQYCVLGPKVETPAGDLRGAYEQWAAEMGARPVNNRDWGERLRSLGCESVRKRASGQQMTVWTGIGLLGDQEH